MEKLTDWTQIAIHSLVALGQTIMSTLPNLIGALFLIIIGWVLAKILSFAVRKALRLVGFDKFSAKIKMDDVLERANVTITASQLVGKFVYWIIILLFFVTASDTLGWTVVSQSISDLIAYIPKLFSGIIIFIIGLYIADFIKKGLIGIFDSLGISSGKLVSDVAFYIILVLITMTALSQAGVDTTIITSNITVILGGIILAFAVSFGLGSRDVLTNILSSFYSRNNFKTGQKIEMQDVSGTIVKIDSTSCTIKTKDGKIIIPVSKLLSENVKVFE